MAKARILTLSKVMPNHSKYDSVKARKRRQAHRKDLELQTRCRNAWNNLSGVRETRARTMRYCTGDQWSDTIRVYHHGYWEEMSERTYEQQHHGKHLGVYYWSLCQAGHGTSLLCKR